MAGVLWRCTCSSGEVTYEDFFKEVGVCPRLVPGYGEAVTGSTMLSSRSCTLCGL